MENAWARVILGPRAVSTTSKVITADTLDEALKIGSSLADRKPWDLIKDELAFQLFVLNYFLAFFHASDITRAYFLMPFVCLKLAVRNPQLS
jgi:hypothetical protein